MYVNTDYLDYHYIVEYSDNYIVLCNRRTISASFESPTTYDVIIQYFTPSTYCLESTRTTRTNLSFDSIDVSDSFYSRPDCPQLMITIFCWTLFVVYIINGLTKFVKKGGIFFG